MNADTFTRIGRWIALIGGFVAFLMGAGIAPDMTPLTYREFEKIHGVEIVWMDELTCAGEAAGGCYRTETPGVIYVRTGMSPEYEWYVLLHETAHALGISDECAADDWTESLGATGAYDC